MKSTRILRRGAGGICPAGFDLPRVSHAPGIRILPRAAAAPRRRDQPHRMGWSAFPNGGNRGLWPGTCCWLRQDRRAGAFQWPWTPAARAMDMFGRRPRRVVCASAPTWAMYHCCCATRTLAKGVFQPAARATAAGKQAGSAMALRQAVQSGVISGPHRSHPPTARTGSQARALRPLRRPVSAA